MGAKMDDKEKQFAQMMAGIADIGIEQILPHEVCEVICVKCGKRWISVHPERTLLKELECPNCGQGFVIKTGQLLVEGEVEDEC